MGSADPSDAAGKPLVVPAHTTGKDGTVVTYGEADAPHTMDVYLDPCCPFCVPTEKDLGKAMRDLGR